jgi:hypothetical protein
MAMTHFFYDEQIRSYLKQFCAIFEGLVVQTGIGESGTTEFISVPTIVGNRDRVVAAIAQGNTTNRSFSLPIMSAWVSGLELAPERRKGVGQERTRVFMKPGEVFPDDLKTVTRVMPIPYNLQVELSLYASNTMQLHQILEQILMLFDPILQIQTNDSAFDWTRLTYVEMIGINNEENYPSSQDKRTLTWSFNFVIPIWISPPMAVKADIVRKIILRLGDMDGFDLREVDELGNPQPFQTLLGPNGEVVENVYTTIVTDRKV